jgi:hypothetical protein
MISAQDESVADATVSFCLPAVAPTQAGSTNDCGVPKTNNHHAPLYTHPAYTFFNCYKCYNMGGKNC